MSEKEISIEPGSRTIICFFGFLFFIILNFILIERRLDRIADALERAYPVPPLTQKEDKK